MGKIQWVAYTYTYFNGPVYIVCEEKDQEWVCYTHGAYADIEVKGLGDTAAAAFYAFMTKKGWGGVHNENFLILDLPIFLEAAKMHMDRGRGPDIAIADRVDELKTAYEKEAAASEAFQAKYDAALEASSYKKAEVPVSSGKGAIRMAKGYEFFSNGKPTGLGAYKGRFNSWVLTTMGSGYYIQARIPTLKKGAALASMLYDLTPEWHDAAEGFNPDTSNKITSLLTEWGGYVAGS